MFYKIKDQILIGVVLLLIALAGAACAGRAEFKGTVLADEQPAPNFELTDQQGKAVSLVDLRGSVVVLTFLYTSCPDICPLITQQLSQFQQKLRSTAQDVVIVAITVDPETDTVERVRLYSEAMGLKEQWYYLTGSREQLDPIWKAYYVAPLAVERPVTDELRTDELRTDELRLAGLHTAPVFLIDRQGRRRLYHAGGDLSVEALLHDVYLLLKES